MIAAHRGHEAIAFSLVGRGARTHDVPDVPTAWQPEVLSREVGHAAIADYLRDVRAAGGIAKYRSEPRLQLLLLRALCSQGRASVIDDRAEEDAAATAAVEPHHHAKRRRLLNGCSARRRDLRRATTAATTTTAVRVLRRRRG